MIRSQIQLTDEQVHQLKEIARREGVSVAEVIRQAVDRRIANEHGDPWKRATEAVGSFNSGLPDVSERHDDYLDDAYE